MPHRKWIAAQVTAIGAFICALINNGWELSSDLQVILVGVVVQAIATYLVPTTTTAAATSLSPSATAPGTPRA
jgi:hypothetical protein